MNKLPVEVIVIACLTFLISVAKGLVYPDRRGVLSFVSGAISGVSIGVVVGVISAEFGSPPAWQYLLSCGAAVFGDRLLFAVLVAARGERTTIHIHGGQNNVGETEIHGSQEQG